MADTTEHTVADETAAEETEEVKNQATIYTETIELDLPTPSIPIIERLFCEPFDLCITIFGYTFCAGVGPDRPDTVCNQVETLLAPLNSLLGMVNPFFLLIDVFLKIQDCILAIPEAIMSLSPDPLLECIQGLIEAILILLCLFYPPFAFPVMIVSVLKFIVRLIKCIRDNIKALCDTIERINNLDNLLLGDPSFIGAEDLIGAARDNAQCRANSTISALGSVCSIIAAVNGLIQLANSLDAAYHAEDNPEPLMPVIPCPDFAVDTPCEEILAIIDTILDALSAFVALAPDCPPAE